jgi:Ca2+/Na+ antiporter
MPLPILLLLIAAATALVWLGSDRLEQASVRLAGHYGLPPVVQGGLIAAVGSSFPELAGTVDYAAAAPMMGALTLATIVLFALLRTDMALTRCECLGLLMLYLVFVAWIGLETAGVTSLVE